MRLLTFCECKCRKVFDFSFVYLRLQTKFKITSATHSESLISNPLERISQFLFDFQAYRRPRLYASMHHEVHSDYACDETEFIILIVLRYKRYLLEITLFLLPIV